MALKFMSVWLNYSLSFTSNLLMSAGALPVHSANCFCVHPEDFQATIIAWVTYSPGQ